MSLSLVYLVQTCKNQHREKLFYIQELTGNVRYNITPGICMPAGISAE